MNNIISVTYLTSVCIILLPISYLTTLQIFSFIKNIYTLKSLERENQYQNFDDDLIHKLMGLYLQQKLWVLAINNLENALEIGDIQSSDTFIEYSNAIKYIYRKINYKKL